MKTIEELKSMSQEDLVRFVQELQERNDKLQKENDENKAVYAYYTKKNADVIAKAQRLIGVLDGVVTMGKEMQW